MKNQRYLSQQDAATLSRLAENLLRIRDVKFNHVEKLIELITNSVLLPENGGRQDYVSLDSAVAYRDVGSNECHSVVIVCPHDANDMLANVSILEPLAMALLGRVIGSIVEVHLPFRRVEYVEIVNVRNASSVDRGASIDTRRGTALLMQDHNDGAHVQTGTL